MSERTGSPVKPERRHLHSHRDSRQHPEGLFRANIVKFSGTANGKLLFRNLYSGVDPMPVRVREPPNFVEQSIFQFKFGAANLLFELCADSSGKEGSQSVRTDVMRSPQIVASSLQDMSGRIGSPGVWDGHHFVARRIGNGDTVAGKSGVRAGSACSRKFEPVIEGDGNPVRHAINLIERNDWNSSTCNVRMCSENT